MGSNKTVACTALLLSLNLLLFSMVNAATCPANSKFLQCAPVLVSKSYYQPCCSLLGGLADLDAALCLCAAIKANVLGIILVDLQVALEVILTTACGRTLPSGFTCTK